jgi:hypothetical protein
MEKRHFKLSRCVRKSIMESVLSVTPKDNHLLELKFNTGETRQFDAKPYLDKGVFKKLKDYTLFKQAYVAFDTVCWPGNLDISPNTLYDKSVLLFTNNN